LAGVAAGGFLAVVFFVAMFMLLGLSESDRDVDCLKGGCPQGGVCRNGLG